MEKSKSKDSSRNLLLSSSFSLTIGASTKTSHTHTHMFTRNFVCSQASFNGYYLCLCVFFVELRRLPEWMHLPSTVLKKRTCFGIPLIQKFMVFKKKENDITLQWFYHYNILQQWILAILQPFSHFRILPRDCQRSVPKSSVVLSQASKTSKLLATWLNRFRCTSLRSGAGSFGRRRSVLKRELNFTKANGIHFVTTIKLHMLLYIYTFQCISWNIYMCNHVELIGKMKKLAAKCLGRLILRIVVVAW